MMKNAVRQLMLRTVTPDTGKPPAFIECDTTGEVVARAVLPGFRHQKPRFHEFASSIECAGEPKIRAQ
jgi:hypothetical protein